MRRRPPFVRALMTLAMATLGLATLGLAACDGGGDPVQQALRDASAARHAATVKDGEVSGPVQTRSQVFAASETELYRQMTEASGETVDQAFVAKMIVHHQGDIAMARIALSESQDPEIRRMAQKIIDTRTDEIPEMKTRHPSE